MTDKQTLRSELRARRAEAGRLSIPAWPTFLDRLTAGLVVAGYFPVGGEADPVALLDAALSHGCRLAMPHVVDRATPLRFLAWNATDTLIAGPFGLHQPAHDAPERAPDIILTPLLGFDRRGNRLGQGAGHYDRAFAVRPDAWRVGIALAVQEVAAIPADPWDVPLHAIASDREWICP